MSFEHPAGSPFSENKNTESVASKDPRELLAEARKRGLHTPLPQIERSEFLPSKTAFFPENEIRSIQEAPRAERPEKLRAFKEQFLLQQEGLAHLYDEVVKSIREDPDISLQELMRLILDKGKDIGINDEQRTLSYRLAKAYIAKHANIRAIREEYPDNIALFTELTGKEPAGDIEITEGPITLYFRCFDPQDFITLTYSQSAKRGIPLDEFDEETLGKCRGMSLPYASLPGLEGSIIAENSIFSADDSQSKISSQEVYQHEEQHAIRKLFDAVALDQGVANYLQESEDPEEYERGLRAYLRRKRSHIADQRASDEILAHLRGGGLDHGKSALMEVKEDGGIYDYLHRERERVQEFFLETAENKPGPYAEIVKKVAQEVFIDEYHKLIDEGIEILKFLKRAGYSDNEIISLLMPEPFSRWKKVTKRIVEAKYPKGQEEERRAA